MIAKPYPNKSMNRADQAQQTIYSAQMKTSATQTDFDAPPSSPTEPLSFNQGKSIKSYEP